MKKRDAALAFDGAERISEGDAEAFKCAGCGANMRYEPSAQKIVCDHCGSEVDIAADTNVTERDFPSLRNTDGRRRGLKRCAATTAAQRRPSRGTRLPPCALLFQPARVGGALL